VHHQTRRDVGGIERTARRAAAALRITLGKQRGAIILSVPQISGNQHANHFTQHPAIRPKPAAVPREAPNHRSRGDRIDAAKHRSTKWNPRPIPIADRFDLVLVRQCVGKKIIDRCLLSRNPPKVLRVTATSAHHANTAPVRHRLLNAHHWLSVYYWLNQLLSSGIGSTALRAPVASLGPNRIALICRGHFLGLFFRHCS